MKPLSIMLAVFLVMTTMTVFADTGAEKQGTIGDANDPEVIREFEQKFEEVVKAVLGNPDYKVIPLKKKDQNWLNYLSFQLWNNEISKEQFIKEGVKRFPKYRESFEFLATALRD